MKIIVDTFGADKGVETVVKGAIKTLKSGEHNIVFVGEKSKIQNIVRENQGDESRIEYIETGEFISNSEEPAMAIRRRKDASIPLGLRTLNEEGYDGFLSCGSTGALLAGGTLITKRMKGVERAALTVAFPTVKGVCVILDVGANMDCSKELLCQFALMGSEYAQGVYGVRNPKVALLNIGTEQGKGDKLRKESFDALSDMNINFTGNIEAREALSGDVDVIVSDGFAGNILLKSIEGTAMTIMGKLKEEIKGSFINKMGALLMKPGLRRLKNMLDYSEFGAAPLLGVKKPVFKAHGSSDERAVETGVMALVRYISMDINTKIADKIEKGIEND